MTDSSPPDEASFSRPSRGRSIHFTPPQPRKETENQHPPRTLRLLTIKARKLTDLPDKSALIEEADMMLMDSYNWKSGKVFSGMRTFTQTCQSIYSADAWCAVTDVRPITPDFPYAKIWEKMSRNRIPNQQKYTPEMATVNDIKTLSMSRSIWSVSYDFGSPLSPRVITMLQIVKLVNTVAPNRCGLAITVPINLDTSEENLLVLEDLGVKGRFATVEWLKEFDDGKHVEWRKLMCGDFGGLIPKFYIRRSMPEKMGLDAHRFLTWLYQVEEPTTPQGSEEEEILPDDLEEPSTPPQLVNKYRKSYYK